MTFYSIRPRAWAGQPSRPVDAGPNPYDPGSRRFAERHRETETALPGGLVRVDLGEPVKRLPCEGLLLKTAKVEPSPAPPGPASDPMPTSRPRPIAPPRPRRDPWGLNRDEG